jgi:hypothetical protein
MPPADPLQLVIEKAAGQGLLVLCLVVGIYAVSKLLAKTMEERVNDLKDRIAALEVAVKECESDRARLWQRLADDERHRTFPKLSGRRLPNSAADLLINDS